MERATLLGDTARAISQENVEIIRRLLDAWNRQDIEGILELTHAEAEYVNVPMAVEPGTRRGHEGIVAVMQTQWESLPGASQKIDRLVDRGGEIITVGSVSRTMPGSDARISNPSGCPKPLLVVRNGERTIPRDTPQADVAGKRRDRARAPRSVEPRRPRSVHRPLACGRRVLSVPRAVGGRGLSGS